MATTTKKAPAKKAEPKLTACECGCGEQCPRRYLPGHDAKHKSALIAVATAESATAAQRRKAEQTIEELGWTQFLVKSQQRIERQAKARAEREQAKAERAAEREKAKAEKAAKAKARKEAAKARKPKTTKPEAKVIETESA